jgi:choline dehydrogenase
VRSTDPILFSKEETPSIAEDSSSGPGAPDLEIVSSPSAILRQGLVPLPPAFYWSMLACLLRYGVIGVYYILQGY